MLGAGVLFAVSIHVVAAFLYCGLAGRSHWHSAVLAPRVVASAFGSGPALLVIVLFALALAILVFLLVTEPCYDLPVRDE